MAFTRASVEKHVVAHGGEDLVRVAGNGGRVRLLFVEADDAVVGCGLQRPEIRREAAVHRQRGHRHLGVLGHVVLDHVADVHAVDVVGTEHHHDVGRRLLN